MHHNICTCTVVHIYICIFLCIFNKPVSPDCRPDDGIYIYVHVCVHRFKVYVDSRVHFHLLHPCTLIACMHIAYCTVSHAPDYRLPCEFQLILLHNIYLYIGMIQITVHKSCRYKYCSTSKKCIIVYSNK